MADRGRTCSPRAPTLSTHHLLMGIEVVSTWGFYESCCGHLGADFGVDMFALLLEIHLDVRLQAIQSFYVYLRSDCPATFHSGCTSVLAQQCVRFGFCSPWPTLVRPVFLTTATGRLGGCLAVGLICISGMITGAWHLVMCSLAVCLWRNVCSDHMPLLTGCLS